jgi:hypothetical protein
MGYKARLGGVTVAFVSRGGRRGERGQCSPQAVQKAWAGLGTRQGAPSGLVGPVGRTLMPNAV